MFTFSNSMKDKIKDIEIDIIKLKQQINSLILENDDLRNKVLRKIQTKKIVEEETESEDLYSKVLIKSK